MQKATIMVMIFCNTLLFGQIFLSLQVKWSEIINNKHGIYKLPHELPNDLRLRILGISETSRKSQIFLELKLSAQSSSLNDNVVNTSKKLLKNRNWVFPVVRYFTWKLESVSNILSVIVGYKFLTNSIQYVNDEWWKITEIHLIFVYFGKLLSHLSATLNPVDLEVLKIKATLKGGAWP